jgi:hypothetical protein
MYSRFKDLRVWSANNFSFREDQSSVQELRVIKVLGPKGLECEERNKVLI